VVALSSTPTSSSACSPAINPLPLAFPRPITSSFPVFVLGELYFGAYKSAHPEHNVRRIEEFAATSAVLACDAVTAAHYGRIKRALREKGRPLPDNDIWIAALAQQHGVTVISRDQHFKEIENLPVEAW